MKLHSIEQLHGIAETLGAQKQMTDMSKMLQIRSVQQSQNEEPCFATDKNYCCGKDCEWREDCHALQAVWLWS